MAEHDVAFLPHELAPCEVAIVVDVLRATSTATQALAAGYRAVHCAPSAGAARALAAPGRVLAGERHCLPIAGFDLGNSPAVLAATEPRGEELVLATTNGTPAVSTALGSAEVVLLGCLLNLDALTAAVPAGADVTVVCAGTDGRFALEDAYVAGRIIGRLAGGRSDAARSALRVARSYSSALEPLAESAGGRALFETGQAADVAWCVRESVLDAVPEARWDGDGGAVAHRSDSMISV